MVFFTYIFFALLITSPTLSKEIEDRILQKPESLDLENLERLCKTEPLEMIWELGGKNQFTGWEIAFIHQGGKTGLKIKITGEFTKEIIDPNLRTKFIETHENGISVLTYTAGAFADKPSITEDLHIVDSGTTERLEVKNEIPKKMSAHEAVIFLKNKKALWYTGAELSRPIVPSMEKLLSSLKVPDSLENADEMYLFTKQLVESSEKYIAIAHSFFNKCIWGIPTHAHYALAEIAIKRNEGIITENIDLLHQRSGIKPLSHYNSELEKLLSQRDLLKKIDCIVTVGLPEDQSGILNFFKKQNPCGIIIAFHAEAPNYIGKVDYLVQGSVQRQIRAFLKELESH